MPVSEANKEENREKYWAVWTGFEFWSFIGAQIDPFKLLHLKKIDKLQTRVGHASAPIRGQIWNPVNSDGEDEYIEMW